jgi:ankyrin repeat protein
LLLKGKQRLPERPFAPQTTSAHTAAAKGDLFQLKQLAKGDPHTLLEQDRNGWRPIHEAARGGQADVVDYLIKNGAEVNDRTNDGRGATALWWAENLFDDDHPVVQALRRHGAVNLGPMRDEL